MIPRLNSLLGISSSILAVNAVVAPEPKATARADFSADGTSPAPTSAPKIHELVRRQNGETELLVTFFSETCGYVSGESDRPVTCPASYSCAMVSEASFLMCASGITVYGWSTCLDRSNVRNTATCDDDCLSDTLVLKW